MIPNSVPPDASESERLELQAAHAQLEGIFVDRDAKAMQRWAEIRYDLPLDWQDTQWISSMRIWGSVDQIREFVATVVDLAEPLTKPSGDAGSASPALHFVFRVLPQELPDDGA